MSELDLTAIRKSYAGKLEAGGDTAGYGLVND